MFKDYSFVFDIDGTLCPIKKKEERYEDLVPFPEMIEKLRYYKENGARIVLYTSRNMNTYNGNLGLINKHTAAGYSAMATLKQHFKNNYALKCYQYDIKNIF